MASTARVASLALGLALLGSSGQAWGEEGGEGQHCVGRDGPRWVYHQLLLGQYQPFGIEHLGRVGVCSPLVDRPGVLFDFSNVELGLAHYLSPAYGHLGGYLQVAPLSILILRAEATGLAYFPFPMEQAAYFPRPGYEASVSADQYPADQGEAATGWNVNLVATLQAEVGLGRLSLIVADELGFETWKVGEAEYYYNLRRSMVLARLDRLLYNEALVLLEVPLRPGLDLWLGAYDSLRYVIEPGMLNHAVGLAVMVNLSSLSESVRGLVPFLRVGWYTHPESLRGATTLIVGVALDLDLGPARSAGGRPEV